jgi:O6-methylguanine-DNA--protein-cysteine methyltransferase
MSEPKTQFQVKRPVDKMLTLKEQRLIDALREIPFGRVVIYLENGEPARIEEALKSIKF